MTSDNPTRRFFCYIVVCADGTYYTGWSTDPRRRAHQHNQGRGARYTRQRSPVQLVYVEEQPDRPSAMRREVQIKRMSRARKETLIADEQGSELLETFSREEGNEE
jgi:putative endonuclease